MKRVFLLILALCISGLALAENYPHRSDYLWTTVPDHADWLYQTGQKAKVEVSLYRYGMPVDALVEYEIGDDMLPSDSKGSVQLKGGRAVVNMGSRKTPGFRDLRLKATVDGAVYSHHVKLGFSVDKIQPFTKLPKDFVSYWESTIAEAEKFPLSYSMEPSAQFSTPKVDCFLVRLYVNRSQSVYGYLFIPKDAKPGSCPVVLTPPGAGIKTIVGPERHIYYAESGCIRFETEIHGLDPRLPSEAFSQFSAAFNGRENGYLSNGLEDKDRYYMRRVYISLVRSIDFLTSLPQWDGKNVAVQGGSQGGALSIVAAGLDKRVTHCIANHPALADMAGYSEKGRTGGYPHFNRVPDFFTPNIIENLAYYDVVNFARQIKAKVRMTWGYNDDVCPPTTSYAVWNVLDCPKQAHLTPINEHWTTDSTERGHLKWLLDNLN